MNLVDSREQVCAKSRQGSVSQQEVNIACLDQQVAGGTTGDCVVSAVARQRCRNGRCRHVDGIVTGPSSQHGPLDVLHGVRSQARQLSHRQRETDIANFGDDVSRPSSAIEYVIARTAAKSIATAS